MKAIVCTKYGPPDVLQLQDVAKPTPMDNEVLIRVHAATVTAGDCELRSLKFPLLLQLLLRIGFGFRGPRKKILGQELAGEIEAVGNEVTRFRKGDQVFGWSGLGLGAYAEYTCLPEKGVLAIKPATITYEEAAALPVGGLEAVYFLRKVHIQPGQQVLICGAGGSIGTFAVQLAKYFGAEVTAVDSTGKLDMLRSIGADQVIDYTQADFTKNGETYDVIFDVVGKSSFSRSIRSLTHNGRYLLGNPRLSQRVRGRWISRRSSKKVIPWKARIASEYTESIHFLTELLEAGKIHSVIDKCYPLEQTAEAHRYVDTGRKKGNVVIKVEQNSSPQQSAVVDSGELWF
jgi:NADPH:quinone reductase-like Zn-dependent oxidoreductase